MLGAIIGDIVGSRFEWHNHKSKDFKLFNSNCRFTDDTVMTIAIAKALLESKSDYSDLSEKTISNMQELGRKYPNVGYGGSFNCWLRAKKPMPYNSWGNGAVMRISPVGFAARFMNEAKQLALKVTEVTHNHPEGLKGAEAIAVAIYMARIGKSKDEIKQYMEDNYYKAQTTVEELQKTYKFDVSTQGSVPPALECFYESTSFEDCIRNAISIGGDSDTIGAIVGGLAEAYYGIPEDIKNNAFEYLPDEFIKVIEEFEEYQKKHKFVRVMDGTKSNEGGFDYKIDEINISSDWNPNETDREKVGGFNFSTEDKILRWLHRGDTIYDVIIPEDAEVVELDEEKGIWRTNKIIVTNPREITDEIVMEIYKETTLSNKILAQCLQTLLWKNRMHISKYIINDRVNKSNVDEFISEFENHIDNLHPCKEKQDDGSKIIYKMLKEIKNK